MECSKNYRQQLIDKIVDFGNTTEYEILHNDNMESDSQSSNEDNCSSSDSCSDMDVDNTEEHKEQCISKQEQIDKKTFVQLFSQWSKYNNASQIYKTRKLKWPEKTRTVFDHYKIFGEFAENNRKSQSRLQERLRMSMLNTFSVGFIKTDHYQPKIFEHQLNWSSILMLEGQE